MKAAVHTIYGPPEIVQIKEYQKPVPKANEVLVRVFASTVNRTDCGFRSAEYFISRFWSGLLYPKHQILGCEFAGQIEQVGSTVKGFTVGDRVLGYNDEKFGGHAEYLTIAADAAISLIPDEFSYEEVAPLTEGAHYALCIIRAAKVQKGQSILVYGATGAIGTAAVQLLKHFGANVTAVSNSRNIELVKSLGADKVVDYENEDFTDTEVRYNFILDAVGKSSFGQCKKILSEKGIYISTELGKNGENVWLSMTASLRSKKVLFPLPTSGKKDVEFLCELLKEGKLKPVIDRIYNLDDIVEAYKYVETGQKTGNVVVRIN
jgi:NADPH:quinone reductase-like Zn-dependent oxidoreductase